MNIHRTEAIARMRALSDAKQREQGQAEFHAREIIRELIRLHGRTKTEFKLSAWFEDEASRIIE